MYERQQASRHLFSVCFEMCRELGCGIFVIKVCPQTMTLLLRKIIIINILIT